MIVAAALCPWPPLLVRELTGADPVLPDLRAACAGAVAELLSDGPEEVAVVGPGIVTVPWPGHGRLNVAAFGGPPYRLPPAGTGRCCRRPPGSGPTCWTRRATTGSGSSGRSARTSRWPGCRKLGADLAGRDARTALLVIGDGSARRGPRAPGHFDERAGAFDAAVEQAIRAGDTRALLDLDPALARELMATGRPAWQVLAGALETAAPLSVAVRYAGDPFGVAYLVASLRPSLGGRSHV